MNKKLFCLIICIMMIASLPMTAFAETAMESGKRNLPISTPQQLLTFAENCRLDSYSKDLNVTLHSDIDLTGYSFEGIPIFCGSFNGNGHVISGVNISAEGSNLGFFRYIHKDATVYDLTVEGSIQPQGSRQNIGGIAGNNAGTILNCRFRGSVSGSDYAGGIAGSNAVSGLISECEVHGELSGNHFVGGITGDNAGVIRSCLSRLAINTVAQQNTIALEDVTMESLTNSEASYTVTDIGGIAGNSSGVIRSCINYGNVGYTSIGYNVGGIAGTQIGFITDCSNYGAVNGRKEVGGIAGQMEPVTNIEYTEDTLQILQGQLGTMSSLANRASAHAQEGSSDALWHISGIQDNIVDAQEALDMLLEEGPDPDTLIAAENALSNSMKNIENNLSGAASALYDTVGTVTSDMRAISNQINAMQKTIQNASENVGGTITDISDLDTLDDLVGKVSHCQNYGSIFADANAGGIAGAISPENDMNLNEGLEIIGDQSMNYDTELRAVIRSCTNQGTVTAKKQNAGGIVGWMPMGLTKDCINLADVDASTSDYVGGIAGQSSGFIRECYSKSRVTGDSYVGGIAGTAATVTDCRSISILSASEKSGAVIGYTAVETKKEATLEEDTVKKNDKKKDQEEEKKPPISGNFYAAVDADPGAIDGISYHEISQPLTMAQFQKLTDLPAELTYYTVRFAFASGTSTEVKVAPNTLLTEDSIPNLAIVDGRNSHWVGLPTDPITFDGTVYAAYDPLTPVLESAERSASGKPLLLLEGSFFPDAEVHLGGNVTAPDAEKGYTILSCASFDLPESEESLTAHYLLEEDISAEELKVYVCSSEGTWESVDFHYTGSYLVFHCPTGLLQVAVAQQQKDLMPLAAGAVLMVLFAVVLLLKKKK